MEKEMDKELYTWEKKRNVQTEAANELEARKKVAASSDTELQEAARHQRVDSFQAQATENDNLRSSLCELFEQCGGSEVDMQHECGKAKCEAVEPDSLDRAIELIKLLHEEVSRSSFTDPKSIATTASGGTTLGISFNDKNASVTACMVGGPAFNSNQVHPNDVIIAIDGQEVTGPEILGLLIGNDKPGSVVELTLKRASVWPCLFCFMMLIDV
jgi:C-terminal processing protease CtpA/Prc